MHVPHDLLWYCELQYILNLVTIFFLTYVNSNLIHHLFFLKFSNFIKRCFYVTCYILNMVPIFVAVNKFRFYGPTFFFFCSLQQLISISVSTVNDNSYLLLQIPALIFYILDIITQLYNGNGCPRYMWDSKLERCL